MDKKMTPPYKTTMLHKDSDGRVVMFVWTDDEEYMRVVRYMGGVMLNGTFQLKRNARYAWERLISDGYVPDGVVATGLTQIPPMLQ